MTLTISMLLAAYIRGYRYVYVIIFLIRAYK